MKVRSAVLVVCASLGFSLSACGQPSGPGVDAITLTPQWDQPTISVPADFAGLSYESALLLPAKDKSYYFDPGRQTLIGMFRTLGVHNLRIGGNTADRPGLPSPAGTDIDNVFQFAAKAKVKVIYTLRLRPPASEVDDAATAAYILQHYGPQVDFFAVGNEPNVYYKKYEDYRAAELKFIDAIRAESPQAKFSGPGTTGGKDYVKALVDDLGKRGDISLITEHRYSGGNARSVKDVAAARADMLSQKWIDSMQKFCDSFVPAVLEDGLPYRMEETNSYYNGGAKDVSDTLASALWGLDYLYWWAEHHASGVNFHTGDSVAAGDQNTPCRYAVFTRDGDGFFVHPLGYAMAAFELGCHGGKLVPLTVDSADQANVRAYGVVTDDQKFFVTVINKENGAEAHAAAVTVDLGGKYARGDSMALVGPNNDLAATSGMKLGGAAIDNSANWQGTWTALQPPSGGKFTFTVPASSAMVVRFVSQ